MLELDAVGTANAFRKYARHLATCALNDESRINVGGDASWNRCDCGMDDAALALDRAWKRGKSHGVPVLATDVVRREADSLEDFANEVTSPMTAEVLRGAAKRLRAAAPTGSEARND